MGAVDLIRQKRDGGALEASAIQAFVAGVTDGTWADYQVSAMLMAMFCRGLTDGEAAALTDAMARSGGRLDLSEFGARVVDKHSTGGVGDKASLVLAPLAAACGVVVPMMSGRGLGHTGGTADKLESIPGFRTEVPLADVPALLRRTGCAMLTQTHEIAPADRRLYALRDVTGTVESAPLIAASILSKKVPEGITGLALDVKVGRGAFMKTLHDARVLGRLLLAICEAHGVRASALLSSMDEPLGRAVGNANELVEAIETLRGHGPADLEALSLRLTAEMIALAGLACDAADADAQARRALASGAGLEAFGRIIAAQGGDPRVLDDPARLPRARASLILTASHDGTLARVDAERVGRAAVALGAGRERVDSRIDHGAGIEVLARVGDAVVAGQPLLRLSAADDSRLARGRALAQEAIWIAEGPVAPTPLVRETLASCFAL